MQDLHKIKRYSNAAPTKKRKAEIYSLVPQYLKRSKKSGNPSPVTWKTYDLLWITWILRKAGLPREIVKSVLTEWYLNSSHWRFIKPKERVFCDNNGKFAAEFLCK